MKSLSIILILSINPFSLVQALSTIDSALVPIDHSDINSQKIYVYYEFGKEFNPSLPVVLAISDAQQYWARPGTAERFQHSFFGEDVNVAVIFGRAENHSIIQSVKDKEGQINWEKAFQFLGSNQWIEDIEAVRKAINPSKKINIYGRSGGGLLLLQYLSRYGQFVEKAFCQTPVSIGDKDLGISHDKFWMEFKQHSPELIQPFMHYLTAPSIPSDDIYLLLQRQNFFVDTEHIHEQREVLVKAMLNNDAEALDQFMDTYQVPQTYTIYNSERGIASRVRLSELLFLRRRNLHYERTEKILPDFESLKIASRPLIELYDSINFDAGFSNWKSLKNLETQVFIFAGRWDHTIDYRSQIYLHGLLPNSLLFIADDNHVFSHFYGTENYSTVVQAALSYRKNSVEMDSILTNLEHLRWIEE